MNNNKVVVQPESLSIIKIFEKDKYIIPIYQRNYAWDETQINQLIEDIYDFSKEQNDSSTHYYLGNLIVNDKGENKFEVIDGQQRLTTLFLLVSYLNSKIEESNKEKIIPIYEDSLEFAAREKANRTLKNIVKIYSCDDKTKYSEEIQMGFRIIENRFEHFKNGTEKINIKTFKSKLGKILIIRTQVPKNIDLNHYFEIMNTRGEQLEAHEIAKSRIIAAIENEDKEKEQKERMVAAKIWGCLCSNGLLYSNELQKRS